MDTSALYSDIVLPAATWYEKADLNSTDMHSFIHPLSAAVPPCWESKSDWDIFKAHRQEDQRAGRAAPARAGQGPGGRAARARHAGRDRPARRSRTGRRASASRSPARPCRRSRSSTRDYTNAATSSSSRSGRSARANGLGAHGMQLRRRRRRTTSWSRHGRPSSVGRRAPIRRSTRRTTPPTSILHLAPETNGELAYRAYQNMEEKTGPAARRPGRGQPRRRGITYKDLQAQPRRLLNSPLLVGPHDRRPRLLAVHLQRRAAACPGARSPAASTSTSTTRATSLRRAPADLQADADAGAVRRPDVRRRGRASR